MKNSFTLIFLFIKQQLAERVFLLCAAIFLALFSAFALLCPESRPISAQIGVSFDSNEKELKAAFSPIFDSHRLSFSYYPPAEIENMKRDIMLGKLHCGYLVSTESDIPITVFENDGSILTPATDEIIFSAWFTARIGDIAPTLCGGRHSELIAEVAEQQRLTAKPLTVIIENAQSPVQSNNYSAVSPLIYAAAVSMSICSSAFCAVLTQNSGRQAMKLLCSAAGKGRIVFCKAVSQAALYFSLLLICEAVLGLIGAALPFSIAARAAAAAVTAVFCAAVGGIFSAITPSRATICAMMLWSIGSVLFSGALISPELFGKAEWLKLISPAWIVLKLMTALS